MALPNLSGSNIQDTFQRVIHTDGVSLTDGTGSALSIVNATTGSFNHIITDGDTIQFRNATTQAVEGNLVFDTTNGLQVKNPNKTANAPMKVKDLTVGVDLVVGSSIESQGNITASGEISASGALYVNSIITTTASAGTAYLQAGKQTIIDSNGIEFNPNGNGNGNNFTVDDANSIISNTTQNFQVSANKITLGLAGQQHFITASAMTAINETTASSHYTHVVQDNDGILKSDTKVKVLKVTGARMKTMGSSPLTVFAAPGANKAIHIDQIVLFVDYATPAANFPAFQTGGVERNKLTFFCIPDDGQSSSNVVPMGAFNRIVINAAKDTIVAKHIPVSQMRLGLNKPIFLRYRRSNLNTNNNAGDSSATPGSDYYFKIKYRVVDVTTDFGPSFTDGAITP